MKQLIINGKKSYDDFDLCISDRNISPPKKKSIKESVPFSNMVYDFSNINGEIYWEERKLEYSFDIAEISTDKMEEVKSKVSNWLMNVQDTDIYDPYIGDYHFHGSFDSASWDEDFGEGSLKVSFLVYPYKISNADVVNELEINKELTKTITNESAHRIAPTIISSGTFTITLNNKTYSVGNGTHTNVFYLESGENTLTIKGSGSITISYAEEMF